MNCRIIAAACVILTGCASRMPGPSPQELALQDSVKCSGYGFTEGTNQYAICMYSLDAMHHQDMIDAQREADERRSAAWLALGRGLQNYGNARAAAPVYVPQQPAYTPPITTTCQPQGFGAITCTSQ